MSSVKRPPRDVDWSRPMSSIERPPRDVDWSRPISSIERPPRDVDWSRLMWSDKASSTRRRPESADVICKASWQGRIQDFGLRGALARILNKISTVASFNIRESLQNVSIYKTVIPGFSLKSTCVHVDSITLLFYATN